MRGLDFEVLASVGEARLGRLITSRGVVDTPAFMPVGTLGSVKGLGPEALEEVGAAIMLSNLYHLATRPGIATIEAVGGLHEFSGWRGPLLTDSGGYQVFSLRDLRRIDDEGVRFRSAHDGSAMSFTPETVLDMQRRLDVDIAMVLDECAPWPVSREQAQAALRRTTLWARRSAEVAPRQIPRAVFGIVQGSFFSDLREQAVKDLVELDFDGYAIGGVSVGEERPLGRSVVEQTAPALPEDKPRYLMGVGTPADIVHAVSQGVDLFDCVLPSRNARHGFLFTAQGSLKIKNARYREDGRPIDEHCLCPACRSVSRAFLHHLIRANELTGKVLATAHNLWFYLDFMRRLREALRSGRFAETAAGIAQPFEPAQP